MNNIAYLLALHFVDGLGPIRLKAVLEYFKDPKLAWEASVAEIRSIGIPQSVAQRLQETKARLDPDKYLENIQKANIRWLTIFDSDYPKLLKEIYDPPIVLYYQGELLSGDENAITIVGTRKITGYGKVVTGQFAKGLSQVGLTIVSGLARGVDIYAHQATVSENSRTIAVSGGGLNKIFPCENRSLAAKIASGYGAVISEFSPDHPALPGNFPARNRIISGVSLAVLVIEAAEDLGSLIAARFALEQGREVFVVPGSITSFSSKGPIDLIKQGARGVFNPDDVFEELGINKVPNVIRQSAGKVQNENLSEEEKQVLGILENESKHIDEISRQLNLSAAKISALFLKMEISGLVQSIRAGIYCKK